MSRSPIVRGSVLLALCLVLFTLAWSQRSGTTPASAQQLFQDRKWTEAASAYELLLKQDSSNALYWSRLGSAYQALQQYSKAARAFERGVSLARNATTLYNLACAYSRLNEKDKALDALEGAASAGFNQPQYFLQDADLANVRAEPRFEAILARVKKNASPCKDDPMHRQFGFWVGDWTVYNPQGRQAGTSSVQNILGGCVIFENWTGVGGAAGKSFNFIDPGTGKWRQVWVSNQGTTIDFTGGLEGGNMVFYADSRDKDGKPFRRKLTFFNLGPRKVRQFSQRSSDAGKTWSVEYDFTYVRK